MYDLIIHSCGSCLSAERRGAVEMKIVAARMASPRRNWKVKFTGLTQNPQVDPAV
jgi:hypothetical protein